MSELNPSITAYQVAAAKDDCTVMCLRLVTTSGELLFTLHRDDLVAMGCHFISYDMRDVTGAAN